MNRKKRLAAACILLVLCIPMLALSTAATTLEQQGLQVTMETDKEHYEPGEPITATIMVQNISSSTVTIASLEQLIPQGYVLVENSQAVTENIDLDPNEGFTMQVTFVGEEAAAVEEAEDQDFLTKLVEGKTWGIPNLLLALIAVVAVIIFMVLT